MSQGNLYRESIASTIHESPRESKAWLGWLFLGMMFGGSCMGIWDMYQERVQLNERASYRVPAESQSWPHPAGHLSQPTAGAR
jgi:hypothetical protein